MNLETIKSISLDRSVVESLTTEAKSLASVAPRAILTAQDFADGQNWLKRFSAFSKKVAEARMAVTRELDAVKAALIQKEKDILQVAGDEQKVRKILADFAEEQERIRKEAERKAREAEALLAKQKAMYEQLADSLAKGLADMTRANATSSVEKVKSLTLKQEAYGQFFQDANAMVAQYIAKFQERATALLSEEKVSPVDLAAEKAAAAAKAEDLVGQAMVSAAMAAPAPAADQIKNVVKTRTWTMLPQAGYEGWAALLAHYLRTNGDQSKLEFLLRHAEKTMTEAPGYVTETITTTVRAR